MGASINGCSIDAKKHKEGEIGYTENTETVGHIMPLHKRQNTIVIVKQPVLLCSFCESIHNGD